MVRLRHGVIQLVAVFSVPAVLTYEHMTPDAKPLRLQLFLKPDIVGAGLQKILDGMSGAIGAVAKRVCLMKGMDSWQHRWWSSPGGRESGRRYQQRQGDNEMFHKNSLEAISGHVKRAA